MNEWISTQNRLPHKDDVVLTYHPLAKETDIEITTMKGWAINPSIVSHWMPLPESPIAPVKRCPHCGEEAYIYEYKGIILYEVRCKDEECIASRGRAFRTREAAVNSWNRRATI